MWIPPHSHTLTPRPKKSFTPPLAHAPTASCGKRRQRAAGDPGSISLQQPKPDLTQRAPVEPSFLSSKPAVPLLRRRSQFLVCRKKRLARYSDRSGSFPLPEDVRRRVVCASQCSAREQRCCCGGVVDVVCFKPHSLILSFPNIQHPCTLLTSGFFQKIGDFQWGSQVSSQW